MALLVGSSDAALGNVPMYNLWYGYAYTDRVELLLLAGPLY
jgi:hypothetical protein